MAAVRSLLSLLVTSAAFASSNSRTLQVSLEPSLRREAIIDASGKWEMDGNDLRSNVSPEITREMETVGASDPKSLQKPTWLRWLETTKSPALPQWIYPVPAYPHHYRHKHSEVFTSFAAEFTRSERHLTVKPSPTDLIWMLILIVCLLMAGWLMKRLNSKLKVEGSEVADSMPGYGHVFWLHFSSIAYVTVALVTFALAWLEVSLVKATIMENATLGNDLKDDGYKLKMDNSGWRSFQAGLVVVLSVLVGCSSILSWRKQGSVKLSNALAAQLIVRGASLALLVAIALEIASSKLLHVSGKEMREGSQAAILGAVKFTLIAGINEEFAKAFSVTLNSVTKPEALPSRPAGCCGQTILLSSPGAIMLAGLSVGLGFMTIENASYVLAMVTIPMNVPEDGEKEEEVLTYAAGIFVVFVRVVFNLHPWLAGLTSGRIARVVFANDQDSTMPRFLEFVVAMAPAAMIHSAYDFLLMVLPSFLGMCMPPVFWVIARMLFAKEFNGFISDTSASLAGSPQPAVTTETEPPGNS
mmetsp:Transcript_26369/g.47522  ORF Transcript_26369/g.47522 Transcript_26369/m.47522 type:complete len:528 (+) Transcript_26369:86-1669(+)